MTDFALALLVAIIAVIIGVVGNLMAAKINHQKFSWPFLIVTVIVGCTITVAIPHILGNDAHSPDPAGSIAGTPNAGAGASSATDEIAQRFIYRIPASVRALGCATGKTMDKGVPMVTCGSLDGANVNYYIFSNNEEKDDAIYYNISDDHSYSKTDCSKGPASSSFYRFSHEGHKGKVLCGPAPDGPTYMWIDDSDFFMGSIGTFGSNSETYKLWRQAIQVAAK